MTSVKTVFDHNGKKDVKRFRLISAEDQYAELLDNLAKTYQLTKDEAHRITLRYGDDDADLCSISSKVELQEALRIAQEAKRKVLVVSVELDELVSASSVGDELKALAQEGRNSRDETLKLLDSLDTASTASDEYIKVDGQESPKAITPGAVVTESKQETPAQPAQTVADVTTQPPASTITTPAVTATVPAPVEAKPVDTPKVELPVAIVAPAVENIATPAPSVVVAVEAPKPVESAPAPVKAVEPVVAVKAPVEDKPAPALVETPKPAEPAKPIQVAEAAPVTVTSAPAKPAETADKNKTEKTENKNTVTYNDAVTIVNKIRSRFLHRPEVYQEFLAVLRQWERKECTVQHIRSTMATLFTGQADLLEEVGVFLPEAKEETNAANSTASPVKQTTPAPSTVTATATATIDTPKQAVAVSAPSLPERLEFISLLQQLLRDTECRAALSKEMPQLLQQVNRKQITLRGTVADLCAAHACLRNSAFATRMVPLVESEALASKYADATDAFVNLLTNLPNMLQVMQLFANSPNLPCLELVEALYARLAGTTAPVSTTTAPVKTQVADKTESKAPAPIVAEPPVQAKPVAVASPTSGNDKPVVHEGVECDGCKMHPIVGVRYKCTQCADFDFCEKCESSQWHHASHTMMKIKVPLARPCAATQATTSSTSTSTSTVAEKPQEKPQEPSKPQDKPQPQTSKNDKVPAPQMEYIKDVTLVDHTDVEAGSVIRKVWALKNTGTTAWPEGTSLIFIGGPVTPATDSKVIVPLAKPGETIELAVECKVPDRTGRAFGNFRLSTTAGLRFGAMIWVDVHVKPRSASPLVKPSAPSAPAPSVNRVPSKEKETSVKPVVDRAPSGPSVEAKATPAPTIPAATPAVDPKTYKYRAELAQLQAMGYTEVDLLMYLLGNNKGDVAKSVDWLLKWNKK